MTQKNRLHFLISIFLAFEVLVGIFFRIGYGFARSHQHPLESWFSVYGFKIFIAFLCVNGLLLGLALFIPGGQWKPKLRLFAWILGATAIGIAICLDAISLMGRCSVTVVNESNTQVKNIQIEITHAPPQSDETIDLGPLEMGASVTGEFSDSGESSARLTFLANEELKELDLIGYFEASQVHW